MYKAPKWVMATMIVVMAIACMMIVNDSTQHLITDSVSSLERALFSTVRIYWLGDDGTTTGTIIGKTPIDTERMEGWYTYYVLTAEHSVRGSPPDSWVYYVDMSIFTDDTAELSTITDEVAVVVRLPAFDVLVVSFDSQLVLEVADTSNHNPINQGKIGDTLYGVGCDVGVAPVLRSGILALKRYHGAQVSMGGDVIDQHPTRCFSPSMNIWGGASGGGIYNARGEYTGMIIALSTNR